MLLTTRSRNLGSVRQAEVTVLPEEPALQLLLRHETRRTILEGGHPEHAEAQLICAILGCLPLALEIAGAHLGKRRQVSLAAYRRELIERGALKLIDDPRGGVRDDDLGTRHAAAVSATLAGQWAAIESDDARLLLRVAGQLPEAAAIPAARLGLLAGVADEADSVFGAPLDQALEELDRLSLVERLRRDAVRLHPLVREFARSQTAAAEMSFFRLACVDRLLEAFQDAIVLEQQCARRGIDALESDLRSGLDLLPREEDVQTTKQQLQKLLRMVQHESHILRGWERAQQPAHFLQQWHKRALISREPQQAEAALVGLANLAIPYLTLQWTTAAESVALEYTLTGHGGPVNAVAVTADGRRAVSASDDSTLKVWDLEGGAEEYTLRGHWGSVNAGR